MDYECRYICVNYDYVTCVCCYVNVTFVLSVKKTITVQMQIHIYLLYDVSVIYKPVFNYLWHVLNQIINEHTLKLSVNSNKQIVYIKPHTFLNECIAS